MIEVVAEPFSGSLLEALEAAPDDGAVRAYWLGQAGFVLAHRRTRVVIDPYLSDSLALKYASTEFAHRRLAPPPIAPAALTGIALVLCTHRHSDHMDPGTLPALALANPGTPIGVPAAERDRALAMGLAPAALHPLEAGEVVRLGGVTVEALASAHEELAPDAQGRHPFLGYAIDLGGLKLYHSGDCVPYPGLAEQLSALRVEVALLPVNGRDAYRKSRGVPGNFHLQEAIALCRAAGVGVLVGHHYGLFEFNTIDPSAARAALARASDLEGRLAPADGALRFARARATDRHGRGPEGASGPGEA